MAVLGRGKRGQSYLVIGARKFNWQDPARLAASQEHVPRLPCSSPGNILAHGPDTCCRLRPVHHTQSLHPCPAGTAYPCPLLSSASQLVCSKASAACRLLGPFPPQASVAASPATSLPRLALSQAACQSRGHTASGPGLPLSGLMTLSKCLDLSESQPPPLLSGYNPTHPLAVQGIK